MPESEEWPLVDERDDGIRPAGPQDACLYCKQKIGQPHARDCVIVTKLVEHVVLVRLPEGLVSGRWTFTEPHAWSVHNSEFAKNESSWCTSNFLSEQSTGSVVWDDGVDRWPALLALADPTDGCLCNDGALEFRFSRVVDATPRRGLQSRGDA